MEKESLYNGKLLVDSRYLDRDDNGYLYYNGKPFTGLKGFFRKDNTLASYIEYVNSIPQGKSESWYESGQKKEECYYDKGRVFGIFKSWDESGQLRLERDEPCYGKYVEKVWNESGQLIKEEHLDDFKIIFLKEWDERGNLIKEEYNNLV